MPTGVVVQSGTVTSGAAGAPLLAPPTAALPGSGPAPGLPPAVGVNDPRTGGGGSVYQPSAGTLIGTELPSPAPTVVTGATEPGIAPITLNTGMGMFVEKPAAGPQTSLADIARRYKSERANEHPRMYDNSNVRHASYGTEDTNTQALPQSDQPIASSGDAGSDGVLDQRDYASVQAALARSQPPTNTVDLAGAMRDPNRSSSEYDAESAAQQGSAPQQATQPPSDATTPQMEPQAPNQTQNNVQLQRQLPASASSLPLLGMIGLLVVCVGGLFTQRARHYAA